EELVRQSDQVLFDFIKSAQGIEYPFLKEHIEYGLPDPHEIREVLNQTGVEIIEFRKTNLHSWLPLMMTNFLIENQPEFRDSRELLNDLFNEYYEESSHSPPYYRTFLLCLKSPGSRAMRKEIEHLQNEDAGKNSIDFASVSLILGRSFRNSLEH